MAFPATNPALARALIARAYDEPTAVQLAVLDAKAAGRDLLVSAQTGSGKTVAFGLALASTLLGEAEKFERAAAPLALIIAPTRELAMQVQRELAWLYAETGARVASCVGGMDVVREKHALQAGCHIVVGTPGRVRDHLERGRLDASSLRAVVLDEADEMLDLGFREDLQFILDATPPERQTLLFSATMPKAIETLARTYQRDALRIETVARDKPHADIEYRAIRTAPRDGELAVVNVLRFYDAGAALVFCSTREAVRKMHLRLAERGFAAVALSGELTQNERNTALQSLRDGRSRVLVATDVAARGLDLPDLALVIHADLPNDRETLLHRSGRTGRAGRKGTCVLIVPQPRRRRAETLLMAAGVKAFWGPAPTADEIRAKDQQRLLSHPIFAEPATEEDLALGRALMAGGRTADEIAMALMRFHRAQLPAPEEIADPGAGPRALHDNRPRALGDRPHAGAPGGDGAGQRADRADRDDMVWFRISIGRAHNADPRWLLPLLCRAGDVSKAEIGTIRIFDRDSRFQIAAVHADRFAAAVKASPQKQGHISRVAGAAVGDGSKPEPHHHRGAPQHGKPATKPYAKPHGKPHGIKPHAQSKPPYKKKHKAAQGQ
jgi:ATP-dependent RNA helicase DeaD